MDTGNYYPRQRDGRIDPIERGTTESRWISDHLGLPVVKAFNNIYARHLLERGKPKESALSTAKPERARKASGNSVTLRIVYRGKP